MKSETTLDRKVGKPVDKHVSKPDKKFDQNRVVITGAANDAIEKVRLQIVNGTDDIEISKSDIANYVFLNLERLLTDQDTRSLRMTHFNEAKYLDMLRQKSARGEEPPTTFRKAMRDHLLEREQSRKRVPTPEKSNT